MKRSLTLALFLTTAACSPAVTARHIKVLDDLRIGLDDEAVGAAYTPDSKLFRIAVVDFVDQTNNYAGKVEDMFADVLTTELFKTNRFTLYDRAQMKRKNQSAMNMQAIGVATPTQPGQQNTAQPNASTAANGTAVSGTPAVTASGGTGRIEDSDQATRQLLNLSSEVDGIFLGFVTNAEAAANGNSGVYTIDYRIVKHVGQGKDASHSAGKSDGNTGSASTLVIFADSDRVAFKGNPLNSATGPGANNVPVTLAREDLKKIADKVRKFFPDVGGTRFSNAKVTDINGRTISISLGSDDIKPGFSFFVATEADDKTGEFFYKGKFVVRDTFDKACRATLSEELEEAKYMPAIHVGDRIVLK